MCFIPPHPFRLFPHSLREERLLGFKPPPREESPEKYRHELQSLLEAVPFTKDQLKDYERRMKAGEASSLLHILSEQALDTPEAERCRVLAESLNARKEMAEEVQRIEQDVLEKMIGEEKKDVSSERKQAPEQVSLSPRKTPFVPPKKVDVPKGPVPAVKVEPQESPWFPRSVDPRTWTNKQIATLSLITVGGVGIGVGLFSLFRLWRNSRLRKKGKLAPEQPIQQEKVQKGGLLRKLVWIPGLGLVALAAYAGHKFLKTFDPYAQAMKFIEEKMEKKYEDLRNLIPFMGEKKEYGLSSVQVKAAEVAYAKTRSVNEEVRAIFGLKDDETNPDLEAFGKEMHAKYTPKYEYTEHGVITYVRADLALEHYEVQIEEALKELWRWMEGHPVELGAIGLIAERVGIIDLPGILRGILKGVGSAGSVTVNVAAKAGEIVKNLTAVIAKHPFLSLLSVGGSFLAAKEAIAQSRKIYLPQNFADFGRAVAANVVVKGPMSSALNTVIESVKDKWNDFMSMEGDFSTWVKDGLSDLASKILEEAPQGFGRTEEETVIERNKSCLHGLALALLSGQAVEGTSDQDARAGMRQKYAEALQRLEEFKGSFLSERGEKVTASKDPVHAFRRLEEALKQVHIELTIRDDIVRWKKEQGKEVDLCVDPSVRDAKKMHELSEKLRGANLGDWSYVALRVLANERERFERSRERGFPGEGWVAVAVGHVMYCIDLENAEEFICAPVTLVYDLFAGKPWTEKVADVESSTVNTALFVMSATYIPTLLKRLATGGPLIKMRWSTAIGFAQEFNPITCPFKVLKDVTGGAVDIDTFLSLRKYGGRAILGGRYINSALKSVDLRPQWIGVIANSENRSELLHVARQIGKAAGLENKAVSEIKADLKTYVVDELLGKRANVRTFATGFKSSKVHDGLEIFDELADWHKMQWRVSRYAAGGEKLLTQGLSPRAELLPLVHQRLPGNVAKAVAAEERVVRSTEAAETTRELSPTRRISPNAMQAAEAATEQAFNDAMRTLRASGMEEVSEDVLQAIVRNPALSRGLLESEPLRQALAHTLTGSKNPLRVVETLSHLPPESLDVLSHAAAAPKSWAKVVGTVESGGDIAGALTRASKIMKVLKGVGIAGDAAAIVFGVLEARETAQLIQRTPESSQELRNLYYQRYGYHTLQIGLGGIGLAGTLGFLGAASAPVAWVTLPLTALGLAAYEGHKWNEAKTRKAADWKRENDLPTLIADTRTYGFGEKVGHAWDVSVGWETLIPMPLGTLAAPFMISKRKAQLGNDIQAVQKQQIEAMVLHTTVASVPEFRLGPAGPDGIPTKQYLSAEEKYFIRQCAQAYFDGKVEYLLDRSDASHAMQSGENVEELLRNADCYGRLKMARFEAQKQKTPTSLPSKEKSKEEQAKEYGRVLRKQHIESLFHGYPFQQEADNSSVAGELQKSFAHLLLEESQPIVTYYDVRSQEENFYDNWPDAWITGRGRAAILRAYLMEEYKGIIQEESGKLVQSTVEKTALLMEASHAEQKSPFNVTAITLLEHEVDNAVRRVRDHFVRRPRELWNSLSQEKVARMDEVLDHQEALQKLEKDMDDERYEYGNTERLSELKTQREWEQVWLRQHMLSDVPVVQIPRERNAMELEESDRLRQDSGEHLFKERGLERGPDDVYIYNADTALSTALYYRYSPGDGWQWSPNKEQWMSVNILRVMNGPFKGVSPTKPNQDFIDLLREASHPNHKKEAA